MDSLENAQPAERQNTTTEATCWECGKKTMCIEYIVCCTGTLFHICPDCEEVVQHGDDNQCEQLPNES